MYLQAVDPTSASQPYYIAVLATGFEYQGRIHTSSHFFEKSSATGSTHFLIRGKDTTKGVVLVKPHALQGVDGVDCGQQPCLHITGPGAERPAVFDAKG